MILQWVKNIWPILWSHLRHCTGDWPSWVSRPRWLLASKSRAQELSSPPVPLDDVRNNQGTIPTTSLVYMHHHF